MRVNKLRLFFAVALIAAAVACGGQKEADSGASPATGKRVDESKAGNVSGRVTIEGTVPANPPIKMGGDPYCTQQNPNGATFENFVVNDGGLENVFVYVKDGLNGYAFEVPTESVKMDQHGCKYTPHVVGIRVGQPLEMTNSDDTFHNVHAVAAANAEWTRSQQLKNVSDKHVFTAREVMVPIKCDVHNWMHAYVGVLDHPYFSVT